MTIQRADTVIRANVASGFGTATDGHVWTSAAGDGQSVNSDEAEIQSSSASTFATLGGSLATADANVLTRFLIADSTNTGGVLARWTNSSNYYLARYDGAGNLAFFKNVGGTKTTVGSYAFAPSTTTFYWLRFQVQGSSIQIKTWQDGTSEPVSWNYSTTDTSLPGTGGSANACGWYGFANFGVNKFDHFSVDDLQSGIALTGELDSTLALTSSGLTVTRRLAGVLAATAGLSGALTVTRPLAGRIDSLAGLSGALTVTRALSGRLDSSLGLNGTLTVGNGNGRPEDAARAAPHRHIGQIDDQAGESSLEGV